MTESSAAAKTQPVILVVEDEPEERFLAATLLEETGFRVKIGRAHV